MIKFAVILLTVVIRAHAQFPLEFPELDEDLKVTTTTTTEPPGAVQEDTVIVDLRTNKELRLKCPKGKEDFVIWFKVPEKKTDNSEELSITDGKYDFPSLIEIKIKELNNSDEGVYYCKGFGEASLRKQFRVVIVDPELEGTEEPVVERPVWAIVPIAHKVVDDTRGAILPCQAEGANVSVTAYRLKDDGTIFKKLTNPGVVLMRPKLDDTGTYMCVAKNRGGRIEYRFNLTVQVHGGFSEWTEWTPCDNQCGFGIKTRRKKCDNPAPANGGRYCTSNEETFQTVQCRTSRCTEPRLTKYGFEITRTSLILHCHSKGIPTPTVQWKINGRIPYHLDHRNPTMVIPRFRAKPGSYSCTIRNIVAYFSMYITIRDL